MISDITGLSLILLKDNIEIKNIQNQNNHLTLKSNFLIEFDKENNIIIEINKESYARILINNITCILMGINANETKEAQNIKLIKIHLNYEPNCKKTISKYRIKDYIDNNKFQNILCIELSPPMCKQEYYNQKEVPNYIKWGAFLESTTITELEEILKKIFNQSEIEIIIKKINKYTTKK